MKGESGPVVLYIHGSNGCDQTIDPTKDYRVLTF